MKQGRQQYSTHQGPEPSHHIAPSLNRRTKTRNNANKFTIVQTGSTPAKVPLKLANQSKLLSGNSKGSQWTTFHIHPKENASKGVKKLRSPDGRPGFKISGSSATDLLDHLEDSYHFDDYEEQDQENDV